MFNTAVKKKRAIGVVLFIIILSLFFSFNRFPKLDIVGEDLNAVSAPEAQCFQGFCIEREAGTSFFTKWWSFSVTYLRLVTVGMTFAFLTAGLVESFLFPRGSGKGILSGGTFSRTIKGAALGPVMNLCSACIVPVSSAFQKRGAGMAGAIALVQGSATMNIPALAMVFFVFTPLLGLSRLLLAVIGALLIGPIVVMSVRRRGSSTEDVEEPELPVFPESPDTSPWKPVILEAFRDWSRVTVGYLARMGPIMIVAGFASGLAIQWLNPQTVSEYLGNHLLGIVITATFGILINVPLLFEIPLVALLLILGMGTAPAATLLFTAAAGGPVTFWGLAKLMPKRAIATFATATWCLGAFGGLAVLGVGTFLWEGGVPGSLSPSNTSQSVSAEDNTWVECGLDPKVAAVTDRQNPVNDPPIAIDNDDNQAHAGTDVILDILCNDLDVDLDTLLVTNLTQPTNGTATINPDNTVTYRSDAEFTGPDSFTYTANDGILDSNVASVEIMVVALTEIRFLEKAKQSGVDFKHFRDKFNLAVGVGAAAGDYNNDGLLDIYLTNSAGSNALYRNNGDGTFDELAASAGIEGPITSANGAGWGDFDNDGNLDLFVAGFGSSRLFRNNGDGTFADVTDKAGVADPDDTYRTSGVTWGDYDQDGYLDLLVVRHLGEHDQEAFTTRFFKNIIRPLALYRNNRDGTFTNMTSLLGVPDDPENKLHGAGFKPSFFDYDNDGDADIYIINDFGEELTPNVLWQNEGDGTFIDVSTESATNFGISGMGLALGDHDNDGDLDMYFTDIGPSIFLDNQGDGTFFDKSNDSRASRGFLYREQGRKMNSSGWGSRFTDLDNDGFLDLYLVAGFLDGADKLTAEAEPNAIFLNNQDGTFSDVSDQTGGDDIGSGREVIAADFNKDGYVDLFVANFGNPEGEPGTAKLFENITDNSNGWLSLNLIGTLSNRNGIGARVTVTTDDDATLIREMGASQGYTSHSVLPIYFGMGKATTASSIKIRWPSGIIQTLNDVPVNQQITVVEP